MGSYILGTVKVGCIRKIVEQTRGIGLISNVPPRFFFHPLVPALASLDDEL